MLRPSVYQETNNKRKEKPCMGLKVIWLWFENVKNECFLFYFFKVLYLLLWAANLLQRHQRECVLDQGDSPPPNTHTHPISLPAVVFMIRGRHSRHLRVFHKHQIFNGIHPSWVTWSRQPEGSWKGWVGVLWCSVHSQARLYNKLLMHVY